MAVRTNVWALVDCGATSSFINRDYIWEKKLTAHTLSQPIPVFNVDGTLNESRSIREVLDIRICYHGHSERTLLAVTCLGKQKLLLGYD